mgnify:CR=1 FL=1
MVPSRAVRIDVGRVVILSGERRVGKSTVCAELVSLAREVGFRCGGLITLAEDGEREVVDAQTGNRRRLTHGAGEGPAVIQGRFRFNPETIHWAIDVLARATPCELLIVDELGPLEVIRGEGWASAIDVVRGGAYGLAVVVVRPELVATVSALLPEMEPELLTVTRENRSRLPGMLLRMLGEPSG